MILPGSERYFDVDGPQAYHHAHYESSFATVLGNAILVNTVREKCRVQMRSEVLLLRITAEPEHTNPQRERGYRY